MNIRNSVSALLLGLAVWTGASYFSARFLVRPNHISIYNIDKIDSKKAESMEFMTEDNFRISAWFVRNSDTRVIVLLSGIRGNRLAQISRAEFFLKKGFSVLMPDLRGTGKSEGDLISFGWHERKDLLACIRELRKLGFSKISVDGQSLGAAAAVYSMSDYADYEFIILESCYDNITNAFRNRINKFPLPDFVFRLVEFFTEKMIRASVQELVPDALIAKIASPVLLLAGDSEYQILTEETVKLFERSESEFKRLHFFKGAGHEDFHAKYRGEFEKTVSDFLNSMNVQ